MAKVRFPLCPDLHNFPRKVFGSITDLIKPPVSFKNDTLVVACSELGTAPDNISFGDRERFFVLQHLAASMPSNAECETYGLSFDSIERLFENHEFRHVIIYGHLRSQVIPFWLQTAKKKVSDVGSFRRRFESGTRSLVDNNYIPDSSLERIELMILEHVLCQIENLMTHTFISERVQAGKTSLYGWAVDIESARVYGYHTDQSAFELI